MLPIARSPDHPRECGANFLRYGYYIQRFGSSPRVRGKLNEDDYYNLHDRIIPASAGQTPVLQSIGLEPKDHPRECGANLSGRARHRRGHGSSPRVRGKLNLCPSPSRILRIIPASAGQTWVLALPVLAWADHPRECGANLARFGSSYLLCGSSPRVRGKHCSLFP